MTRIEGVPRSKAGPLVRLVYSMTRRKARQIAGDGRDLSIEPIEVYAHVPRLLIGYGILEQSVATRPRVEERLRMLAVLKSAVMQGCEFCQDIGSHEARRARVSDGQLLELHRYLRSRFNAAFRIGAAGFSEGQACARMEAAHTTTEHPSDRPQRVLA